MTVQDTLENTISQLVLVIETLEILEGRLEHRGMLESSLVALCVDKLQTISNDVELEIISNDAEMEADQ